MFALGYIYKTNSPSIVAAKDGQLESDERLVCTDLVCEGPIEGLCDKDGELLKYITDETNTQIENLVLGKGVYYNNVPIVDSKLNKLNYVTAGFNISYGEEFNLYKSQYASTVHKYDRKIYLNDSPSVDAPFAFCQNPGFFFFSQDEKGAFIEDNDKIPNNPFVGYIRNSPVFSINGVFNGSRAVQFLDEAKKNCQEFNHKIVNKYADEISIHIRANQLFSTSDDGTVPGGATLAFELSEDNSIARYFGIFNIQGISKSGYTIDIPISLNLNSVTYNNYYIKVYALSKKISPSDGRNFKDFSVTGIVERIKTKGNFAYPFSSIVKSAVSSRHFNQDPDRTFDLKLLKIKVPSNYDPEAREYSGNWDGKFSSFLRWTDNPAWIFYDICTNSRYGIGNGLVLEKDLNKWDLYKIAKYSDELIKITTPNKYAPDDFYILAGNKNIIYITKNGRTLSDIKSQYPPVYDPTRSFANINGGYSNSIIYLYDLKNDFEPIDNAYKKIIWSIEDSGATFKIKLINDFGPRSFFEGDTTDLLTQFSNECATSVQNNIDKPLRFRISESLKNSQSNAKNFILQKFANDISSYSSYIEAQIFPDDFYKDSDDSDTVTLYGKCLPKVLNYRDPFEPRFSCNLLIDNETDALKILNDIASIFRGITYYKNNLVTATIDVDKPIAYIFNNSNVKNGNFSYSTGSLDGNYSVAKVLYKDKYENFTEQVEIVEDYELIRNYGIVIKEILGFGITSKDQARRIGQWLLLTNRFENQTVTFSTDLQGIVLRPSDVIQIEDQYKNNNILQGRVIDVNYDQKYIVIDRQLNLNLTGQKIKFLCDKVIKTITDLNNSSSVSDVDIEETNINQVIELRIERIENNNSRIYLDPSYNYSLFNSILKTTPFVIEDRITNQKENLYKIVTITEAENNEYTLFCIKHDPAKYEGLTNFTFEKKVDFSNNTIVYAVSDTIKQINVAGITFYQTSTYDLSALASVNIDYTFNEPKSSLIKSSALNAEYWVLNLKINDLFNEIQTRSASTAYYKNIQNVLDDDGGILFKIILRNQNIKFYMKSNDLADKNIFLGKFGGSPIFLSGSCEVQLYLFDKNNKIINVDL